MIVEQLTALESTALVELYELNVRDLPNYSAFQWEIDIGKDILDQGIYRFYNGGYNELDAYVTWQGKQFEPFPIEVEGFSTEGEKQQPRPVLSISNLYPIVHELVVKYDDLVGAKITRKRTFKKFLDATNFSAGNAEADATAELPDTVYYIKKKASESAASMTFELSSPYDVEGIKLPRRIMVSDVCMWKYRETPCNYSGTRYYDALDDPAEANTDVCGKHLSSCLLRFPDKETVPFGGFASLKSR